MNPSDPSFATAQEEIHLLRTIQLALRGGKAVHRNPNVGAVLMRGNQVLSEGYHQQFGGNHAEVDCLKKVGHISNSILSESTLYVTLEPCCIHRKTPPCTHLIIEKNIGRVVVGCTDPNPDINGKGLQLLKEAGVQVAISKHEEKYKNLILPFVVQHQLSRPYIILKWAHSKDGYIGKKGKTVQISASPTQALVHRWRTEVDAIAIGTNTAVVDNPRLNNRWDDLDSPTRLVLDLNDRIPDGHHLLDGSFPTHVWSTKHHDDRDNLKYQLVEGEFSVQKFIDDVWNLDLMRVMIEGGKQFLQQFIDLGLWDEARIITSQSELESGIRAPHLIGKLGKSQKLGVDKLEIVRRQAAVS